MSTSLQGVPPSRRAFLRLVAAIVLGNGFIAYDFTAYSLSAAVIGELYFPADHPGLSLLLSLATFGAGFVMRPLGALFIGQIADRFSRKAGMTLSLWLMTFSTLLMACTPTYAEIGRTSVAGRKYGDAGIHECH